MPPTLDPNWKNVRIAFDDRRDVIVPGNHEATLQYCVEQLIHLANDSISDHGHFAVALSGGSTPKSIYEGLAASKYQKAVDWNKVFIFWSDERCVPRSHPDSNYRMAMEAGMSKLSIPQSNIFPMPSEGDLEKGAQEYENLILRKIPSKSFDLIMLGMGEDGHTASLFPKTHALHTNSRLIIPNYISQKSIWRMTMTFECINNARNIDIYVLGKNKSAMVHTIFNAPFDPDTLPIQRVGTRTSPKCKKSSSC